MGSCAGKQHPPKRPSGTSTEQPQKANSAKNVPASEPSGANKVNEKQIDVKVEEKISAGHIKILFFCVSVVVFCHMFVYTRTDTLTNQTRYL